MCWFRKKKDKEKITLLEERVRVLETQIENLNETDGRLAAENYQLRDLIISHIRNDMDMTEGDETTWEEN